MCVGGWRGGEVGEWGREPGVSMKKVLDTTTQQILPLPTYLNDGLTSVGEL